MNLIHTITAVWLDAKLKYDGEPRMVIKNKKLLVWDKDAWANEKPREYKFVRYCLDKRAFQIKCAGKNCNWSHLINKEDSL